MERSGGAAAAAGESQRHQTAARHLLAQSFDLESEDIKILHWATVALNPLADFLPFIESPPFKPQASKAWGFFLRRTPTPSL